MIFSRFLPQINYIVPRWTAPVSFETGDVFRHYVNKTAYLYALVSCLLCLMLPIQAASGAATGVGGGMTTSYAACPVATCLSHEFDPTFNYFPVRALSSSSSFSLNSDRDFTITYFNSYKIIYNNESSSTPEVYVLYQCGTPQPQVGNASAVTNVSTVFFDASIVGLITNQTKYFSVPVANVSIDSSAGSVVTNFLELLGVRSRIAFASTTYISSPCIDVAAQRGLINGYSAANASTTSLVIFGNSASLSVKNAVSVPVTLDTSIIARANWIKFLSTFFNREEAALAIFNSIDINYQTLAENIASSAASSQAPVVAWVSSYQSTIYSSTYRNDLVRAAAGVPLNTSTGATISYGSSVFNISSFKSALLSVDVLIDESYFAVPPSNLTVILFNLGFNASDIDPSTSSYNFIRHSQLWRYDGRDSYNNAGDDWLETAIAQPDAVLADFLRLTHNDTWLALSPFAAINPRVHLWFRNVAQNESFTNLPLVCADTSAPSSLLYNSFSPSSASATFACPPYFADVTLFGGNQTLSGCAVLNAVPTNAFNASLDYFPVKSSSNIADTWYVRYFPSYKFVSNNLSNGAETYVLYQRGTPRPSLTNGPVQLDGSISGLITNATKFFAVPVQTVAVDSSVGSIATAYLELLGVRHTIAFYDATYTTSSCIDLLFTQGVIEYLGYGDAQYENAIARSDLVLEGNSATGFANAVSVASTAASDSLLGYTDWLNFVALFFNKEAAATGIYAQQVANIQSLSAASNTIVGSKPVVAWVQYNAYSTPATYLIDQSRFRQDLVTNGGALNLNVSVNSFSNSSLFHAALLSVDVLIDESFGPVTFADSWKALGFSAADLTSGAFKFFANHRVYRHDARPQPEGNGGDDWEESAIANADAVLADFVRLTQPSVVTPITRVAPGYLWFRNIAMNESQTVLPSAYTCMDPSAPSLPLYMSNVSLPSSYACPAFLLNPAAVPLAPRGFSSSSSTSIRFASSGVSSSSSMLSSTTISSGTGANGARSVMVNWNIHAWTVLLIGLIIVFSI